MMKLHQYTYTLKWHCRKSVHQAPCAAFTPMNDNAIPMIYQKVVLRYSCVTLHTLEKG